MEIRIHWFDVTEHLQRREQPRVLLERPLVGGRHRTDDTLIFGVEKTGRTGTFLVPAAPLNVDEKRWSVIKSGEFVSVPMHAYLSPAVQGPEGGSAASVLVACGLELGVRAAMSLAARGITQLLEMTLVIGKDCHLIEGRYRYYLGLAARTD